MNLVHLLNLATKLCQNAAQTLMQDDRAHLQSLTAPQIECPASATELTTACVEGSRHDHPRAIREEASKPAKLAAATKRNDTATPSLTTSSSRVSTRSVSPKAPAYPKGLGSGQTSNPKSR